MSLPMARLKSFSSTPEQRSSIQNTFSCKRLKGAEAEHPILDNPTFHERTDAKGHKSLPDARLDYLENFTLGFENLLYFDEEREYKLEAHRS